MSVFDDRKAVASLEEIGLDISAIIRTYSFFASQASVDKDFKVPTYRVKIPAGGGSAFDIVTGNEELDKSVRSFAGVIAAHHAVNSLFASNGDGGVTNQPPLCTSDNGAIGMNQQTGEIVECVSCPHNQWGSGRNGSGKACKNMRRIYILMPNSSLPLVLTLPPTSTKAWNEYRSGIATQLKLPQDVVTEFSISKEASSSGHTYSVIKFRPVGALTKETAEAVKSLSAYSYNKTVGHEDYNTIPEGQKGQSGNVAPASAETLPASAETLPASPLFSNDNDDLPF